MEEMETRTSLGKIRDPCPQPASTRKRCVWSVKVKINFASSTGSKSKRSAIEGEQSLFPNTLFR